MLELAVLGLLKEQPLHGYELKKRLGETLGFLWGVSYGSLYPALKRLETGGAIEIVEPTPLRAGVPSTGSLSGDLAAARLRSVADRIGSSGRRTKKAYRITNAGDELFTELMLADDTHGDDEKAFVVKLAFCSHLPRDARLTLLRRRRVALEARLASPRTTGRTRSERAGRTPDRAPDRYLRALVEHRTSSTRRDLEWVDGLIAAEEADEEADAPDDSALPEGATA
jgi:DNA-binding PadR family transcriptional regulator